MPYQVIKMPPIEGGAEWKNFNTQQFVGYLTQDPAQVETVAGVIDGLPNENPLKAAFFDKVMGLGTYYKALNNPPSGSSANVDDELLLTEQAAYARAALIIINSNTAMQSFYASQPNDPQHPSTLGQLNRNANYKPPVQSSGLPSPSPSPFPSPSPGPAPSPPK